MRQSVVLRSVLSALLVSWCTATEAVEVVFVSPSLEAFVRADLINLGADPGPVIDDTDLVGVGFTVFIMGGGTLGPDVVTDLTGLEFATDLVEVDLSQHGVTDLSPLAALPNLRILDASIGPLSDLNGLTGFAALEELDLSSNSLTNISSIPIAAHPNLRVLDATFNTINDASVLSTLTGLEVLNLASNALTNVTGFNTLINMVDLALSQNAITSVGPLSTMASLDTLTFAINNVTDIGPLASLPAIRVLNVADNPITDLSPLSGLLTLNELNILGNFATDISVLSSLVNLTSLAFNLTPVVDLSPLSSLLALQLLETNVTNSELVQLEIAIRDLPVLTILDLAGSDLTDISPLASLTTLTEVRLQSVGQSINSVFDIAPVAGLPNLSVLDITGNQVTDLSPLLGNVGFGSGDTLRAEYNPLSQDSLCVVVPTLIGRGATVDIIGQCLSDRGNRVFYEEGDTLLLSIRGPVDLGSPIQWRKDGVNLVDSGRVTGTDEITLVIFPAEIGDSGIYSAAYDDGSKALLIFGPFEVKVVELGALPVAGAIGIGLLCGLMTISGLRRFRRY